MAGTKEGGKKAAIANKLRHGDNFYATIGRKGGRNGHTGGFASNPKLASEAGRKGGMASRRGKSDKTFWLEHGDQILEDYKKLQNMKLVAAKWGKEYHSIRRFILENE